MEIAYDGTGYHGFALQEGCATIEGHLNSVISEMEGREIEVIGASRTDAGVHALKNLAVFDTQLKIPGDRFMFALNRRLPPDIRIVSSREVGPDFHPRHVKTIKTYCYRILNTSFQDPLKRLYADFVSYPLNTDRMNEAMGYLVGEHDFKSFCSAHTQALSTVREITQAEVIRADEEILIRIKGYGFLYNMVRIIAGTLIEVGRGALAPQEMPEILKALDRQKAGPTAPAQGLTLMEIEILDTDQSVV